MTGNGFIIVNIKIVVEAASRMWRVKWTQIPAAGWWISEGIPVHSACIHRIPVQLSKPTQVDGDARMYALRFPSTAHVYTKSPSICEVCSIPAFTLSINNL